MGDNPLLRHQSLTILQQIEELKNWHKQQQSKTKPDAEGWNSKGNKNCLKSDNDADKHSNIPRKRLSASPLKNFDETPIKVTNTNFIEIVENNVTQNESRYQNQHASKPKFKYLKRGEGIARFRMGPQKQRKRPKIRTSSDTNSPKLKITLDSKMSNNSNGNSHDQRHNNVHGNVDNTKEIAPLHPPDLQLNFKDWKSIFDSGKADDIIENAIDKNRLEIFQPNSSLDSSTVSIMEKLLAAGKKHLKDKEELRAFEAIELHVQDSSFCSTSSYVAKLMENAVISTPEKIPHLNKNSLTQMDHLQNLQYIDDVNDTKHHTPNTGLEQRRPMSPSTKSTDNQNDPRHKSLETVDNDELQRSLHVRFAEEIDYRSFVERSQSVNSLTRKEDSVEERRPSIEDFNDSEEWKQESEDDTTCCSQCSTSYSSSEEDVRAISPPVKHPISGDSSQPGHQKFPQSLGVNKQNGAFEKLHVSDLKTENVQQIESKSCKSIDFQGFPPVLSEKMNELEHEIETFRLENNKLKSIREKLEKEHKSFALQKNKLMKEIEEEKKINNAKVEEERQKLAKEKFIFEKYSKALSKNPTKEERKEIQALRDQLGEMKEELNRKESRWGAAQARVRNQVKLLEEDNKKLKGEIEVLTKKAKQLEFLAHTKKGKSFNNTKLIHAVNEHISALPPEVRNDKVSLKSTTGYFNTGTSSNKTVAMNEINTQDSAKVGDENTNKIEEKADNNIGDPRSKQLSPTEPLLVDDRANKSGETSHLLGQAKEKANNFQPEDENRSPNTPRQILNDSGTVETVFPDGKRELRYKNGNVKKIDPITGTEKTIYFNGDVKETIPNGTVKYYFSESRIWHTTLPDGLELFDFPNGQVEKRHTDGLVEIVYPNNCKKLNYADGSEIIYYPDGTTLKTETDKKKVLSLPNGQKEIHTEEYIRREYPDGTLKIVYADGTTETVYSNGRVRLKDKHGNLVMDSATSRQAS